MNRKGIRYIGWLLALVWALSACGYLNPAETETPPDANPTERPLWESPFSERELTTVYLPPLRGIRDHNSRFLNYMTELAQTAGFPLHFDVFDEIRSFAGGGRVERHMMAEQVRMSVNSVFIVNSGELRFYQDVMGDHRRAVLDYAPELYERYAVFNYRMLNDPGILAIPMDQSHSLHGVGVLIRNDVYEAYSEYHAHSEHEWDIRCDQSYEELLWWAKCRYDTVPGIAALETRYMIDGHYLPLNLFMPGMGYRPLPDIAPGIFFPPFTSLWINPEGNAVEFENTDSAKDAFLRFAQWREFGLINIRRDWAMATGLAAYPTILVSLHTAWPPDLDLTRCTLRILPNTATSTYGTAYAAIAPDGAILRDFLNFLAWLEEAPENYIWFIMGREGEDFIFDEDTGRAVGLGGYSDYPGRSVFTNTAFHGPLNFIEEVQALPAREPDFSTSGIMRLTHLLYMLATEHLRDSPPYYNNYFSGDLPREMQGFMQNLYLLSTGLTTADLYVNDVFRVLRIWYSSGGRIRGMLANHVNAARALGR
jgi:hypothetical protein